MSVHKIGVISDTHNMIRPEVAEILKDCELVIHAGDVTTDKVLNELNNLNEIIAVQGNCDRELSDRLPKDKTLDLFGKKVYIIHDKSKIGLKSIPADIIIYGHSHVYDFFNEENKIWLNPGSCGPRRFGKPASMALLFIDPENNTVDVEKIDLTDENVKKN